MTDNIESTIPEFSVCRCPHLGLVRVYGADAATFLHGQVSNDIAALAINQSAMAAYCNPKGRVIALFRVLRTGEESFLLTMSVDLVDPVVRRLGMFVLRAKVKLEPLDALFYGVPSNSEAAPFGSLPKRGTGIAYAGGHLVNVGFTRDRYLHMTETDDIPDGLEIDERQHLWMSILAADGIPEIFAASSGEFLPQGINLDLLDAVNFRKGCYPGQEIIARLRYLGKLKQRMVRIEFRGAPVEPGTDILAGADRIGKVVLCGPAGGGQMALASVNFARLGGNDPSLMDGTPVSLLDLPYEVPELRAAGTAPTD